MFQKFQVFENPVAVSDGWNYWNNWNLWNDFF
jgi:hypothetical protein